jgi:N-acetylmuramoyl-L-alanine amidase
MSGHRIFAAAVLLAVAGLAATTSMAAAYTVKPGDSLWSISKRTGVPIARIAADNHIANPNVIHVGQQLTIQGNAPAPAPATTPAAAPAAPPAASGATYVVQGGDSLWKIARKAGVPVSQIASLNGISNPAMIHVGQRLLLAPNPVPPPPPPPAAAPAVAPAAVHGEAARQILIAAAREFKMDVAFVLAVSLWESGYNQGAVSSAGAVGLMQIEPATGAWAGPALLGTTVDLGDARSNARLGTALLAHYLQLLNNDPKLALAAYYQGLTVTLKKGILPDSQRYVDGIWALRNKLAGTA